MTLQDAEKIMREYIDSTFVSLGRLVILREETMEKDYGWIFRFTSQDYLEGKTKYVPLGNGPVLIEKSGKIVQFPTAIPFEKALKRYEAGLPFFERHKKNVD